MVEVQTKGLGSGTEWKTPRLMALFVSAPNQRSTRFSHEDVGVKCRG